MENKRKIVRASKSFFEDLDRQLPQQRRDGKPSTGDFQTYELLRIVEVFASSFDTLMHSIPGRDDYRLFVGSGTIVPRYSVAAQEMPDGSVELMELEIDLDFPWKDDESATR